MMRLARMLMLLLPLTPTAGCGGAEPGAAADPGAFLPAASGSISGRVTYQVSGKPVPGATVHLIGPGGRTAQTDADGRYAFASLPAGDFLIQPARTGTIGAAISSLDATYVLQHVAGTRVLGRHARLAADVTADGTISSLDGSRILQRVSGTITQLPATTACGSDWAFDPTPSPAPNQMVNPLHLAGGACQRGSIILRGLSAPAAAQDFTALIFGDTTANWAPGGCAGPSLSLSAPTAVAAQAGGSAWLARSVPTDMGWGLFWLREDPGAAGEARVYYAHVGLDGALTTAPKLVASAPRIQFRSRYYNAAWHRDHFGLLTAEGASLYYRDLSRDGVPSAKRKVGPTLFTSTVYDQEADSDIVSHPGGFAVAVEGECSGHSCSYAFLLSGQGAPSGSVYNLVDFDLTHQFYPRVAFDGTGFALLSVKDIQISSGGVVTKYMIPGSAPGSRAKVAPSKEYLWDEWPALAFNGAGAAPAFAALWTEVTRRPSSGPPVSWQVRFASFQRTRTSSTLLTERVMDVRTQKANHRFATQVHQQPAAGQWLLQYTRWQSGADPLAVFQWVDATGPAPGQVQVRAELTPFTLNADALGSSPHFLAGHEGKLGVVRGSAEAGGSTISFHILQARACP